MPEPVTFEHYEVLTREDGSLYELGRGAMGITYKGFDTRLCVPVALKVINAAHLHSENARQRFVREARAAAQLRHRNVASIFHLGEEEDNYFYVMEFIDGETVEALVRRQGPLPPIFALRIAAQVARALNAAQQHDLVHRDIKPSNLMAVEEDDDLVIKVIDFGLAKVLIEEGESTGAALTHGGILGTPHFASPEQLSERETDARSDIYSLGVTLWFLLLGTPPFKGSIARVVGDQLSKPPPFDDLAAIPNTVVDLLRRMLAKDPAERPQSPAELRKEIEESLGLLGDTPRTPTVGPATTPPATVPPPSERELEDIRFEPGLTIVRRYLITRELGENEAGTTFLTRDLHRDCEVRLLALHRELLADHDSFAKIEHDADSLTSLAHPNVLEVSGLTTLGRNAFFTLAWTTGFTLRQLLRTRRELPLAEARLLLEQAATGLDYATAQLPRLEPGLHHVLIHFPGEGVTPADRLSQPVEEWPEFVVKINPLATWRDVFALTWAAGQTVTGGAAHHERKSFPGQTGSIHALGGIAYELLGGIAAGSGTRDYSPLAALDEAGNTVLRRAWTAPESFASATDFVQQLAAFPGQEPLPPPPMRSASVPAPGSAEAAAGTSSSEEYQTLPLEAEQVLPVQPKSRNLLFPFVVLLVITGGSYVVFHSQSRMKVPSLTRVMPSPTAPPQTIAPATPATPASTPAMVVRLTTPVPITPPPLTPPPPTRRDSANGVRQMAEAFEDRQQSREALAAWLRMATEFPESDAGRVGIELLLDRLRRRQNGLSKAEFAAMQPDIRKAANLGVLAAMMTLGDKLRDIDPAQAFGWYCAAAQSGDLEAMTQAGLMLSNGAGTPRDMRKAAAYFQGASDKGQTTAMTALAECLMEGEGVPQDKPQALALLQKASDTGNLRAKNLLGLCYHKGIGIAPDFHQAFRLFSEAAESGWVEAIGNLGVLYMKGEGVEKNVTKAAEKFKEGSLKGDRNAMFHYAECLEREIGVKGNAERAKALYQKSAAAGQSQAIEWCNSHKVLFKGRQ